MSGPIACPDCGRPISRQCAAHVKSGHRCHRSADHGTAVCGSHGAAARQVKAAALRRLAEENGRRELARLGVAAAPVINPLELLATLAGEAREWQQLLRARVSELQSLTGPDHLGDERARVVVQLLVQAVHELGDLLVAMARLNVDDRLAQINETIAEQVSSVFERSLARMNLREDQWALARVAFPQELGALVRDD